MSNEALLLTLRTVRMKNESKNKGEKNLLKSSISPASVRNQTTFSVNLLDPNRVNKAPPADKYIKVWNFIYMSKSESRAAWLVSIK